MLLPPDELNDIASHIPDLILDIRYATENNFTGQKLYNHQCAWLRHEPLLEFMSVADELAADGYSLVIFDAFRPVSVQRKLRAVCDDSNYVSEVSNHCRGITVDLTLADVHGVYLDMGTDYDDFSEKSRLGTKSITTEQALNRNLLSVAMGARGFVQHPHEWWHFDFQPEKEWPIIDDETNAYTP